MKMILLKILITIAAIIGLLLVIAFFVKKQYTIVREITIDNSAEQVYNYVRFHKNQPQYNHWLSLDPDTKIQIRGEEDGKVGSILYFEGDHKKVGTGEWKNTALIENRQIDVELKFMKPYKFTASAVLYFKPITEDLTKLIWEYKSGMEWPKNIMLLFMDMDDIIGNDIEATLKKIKSNTEK